MTKRIYAAGPIAGLTHLEVCLWRRQAEIYLAPNVLLWPSIQNNHDAHVYPHLCNDTQIKMSDVFRHDMAQLQLADAVLVGYPTGPVLSVGTGVECGVAMERGIPIVVWCSKDKAQVSGFIQEAAEMGMVTDDLYKACVFLREWLS